MNRIARPTQLAPGQRLQPFETRLGQELQDAIEAYLSHYQLIISSPLDLFYWIERDDNGLRMDLRPEHIRFSGTLKHYFGATQHPSSPLIFEIW